jgi:hypothetical protein
MKRTIPALLLAFPLLSAYGAHLSIPSQSAQPSKVNQVADTATHRTLKPAGTIPNYSLGVPVPKDIHGIYVSAYTISDPALFQNVMNLFEHTSLNTMVIDMKTDNGDITFANNNPQLKPYTRNLIQNPSQLMGTLKAHHIYPIARVAVFEDTLYADAHPQDSYLINGTPWIGRQGQAYTNPFLRSVWQYNVAVAKAIAKLGFEQIQFDFVRFPAAFDSMRGTIQYSLGRFKNHTPTDIQEADTTYRQDLRRYHRELTVLQTKQTAAQTADAEQELPLIDNQIRGLLKNRPTKPQFTAAQRLGGLQVDAVTDFVKYAAAQLKPYHVALSVDIFGYTATIPESLSVGQNYPRIAQQVNVISPMIYPSLWGPGYFGLSHPDLYPYQTVSGFMAAEEKIMQHVKPKPTLIPWIQDYTASYLGPGNYQTYTKTQVDEQIQALAKYGVHNYLIWNPQNVYSPGI